MAVVTGATQIVSGFNQAVTSGVVTAQTLTASISPSSQYTNGTGAGQVDLIYAKQLVFVASTPQTLDLQALTDLSGASINFARVREIVLQVVTTTAGFNVTLGAAAANPWAAIWGTTGTHVVFAGSTFYFRDPSTVGAATGAVTSGTSKNLKIDPGSNALTINLLIAGASAVS
jgi:hypothetical protein